MPLFARRPSPTDEVTAAWRAFVETAELVESARRRLLQTLPVGRVTPGAVSHGVEGLRLALTDALAWLPGWAGLPELADEHASCRRALDEAAARLDDVTRVAATTGELEALQGAVEAVVMPLDAFADAERTFRRTWRFPRD